MAFSSSLKKHLHLGKSPEHTSASSSAVDSSSDVNTKMLHRHSSSPSSVTSAPDISLTPPSPYRFFGDPRPSSKSRGDINIPSGGISRGRGGEKTSPPSSRDASVDSHASTDTTHSSISWHKIFSPRSWHPLSPSKKPETPIPKEQTDSYLRTKARVQLAVKCIEEIAQLSIKILAETGELIPVPGLAIVASLLSSIWESLDEVGSNRLACLRLAARSADFLISIREEVDEMKRAITVELDQPLRRLETAFDSIRDLMIALRDQPFWRRWVARDEIQQEIDRCHELLNDCLHMFSISLLTRIFKKVSSSSAEGGLFSGSKDANTPAGLEPISGDGMGNLLEFSSSPPLADDLALMDAERIREYLRAFQEHQNEVDRAADIHDLRNLLSAALNAPNDTDMQKVLQVAGKDMPKAIRSLLAALEGHKPDWRPVQNSVEYQVKSLPHTRAFTWPLDNKQEGVLDSERIESDITRLADRNDMDLPSLTLSKNDITFQELIGRGFFSNVFKGSWRHRIVAIKVLERATERDVFVSEIKAWKSLSHPNILRIYGASVPGQDPPRFLISPYMKNGSLTEYLKRAEWAGSISMETSIVSGVMGDSSAPDLLRFMLEIAQGMEYMHVSDFVHGDLKGANILLDDDLHCVLADFGHSKHLSQISYTDPKHAHGLRWQSPELMSGRSLISKANDVYAFSITCVEIVTFGSLPWPLLPDDVVKVTVLERKGRPTFPPRLVDRLGIRHMLRQCWDDEFNMRPSFSQIVNELEALMSRMASYQPSSPSPPHHPTALPKIYSDPEVMIGSESSDIYYPQVPQAFPGPSRSNTIRPSDKH
ncbi:hypothetical protein D9757_003090 [Collybiopsis confluens]|uniref:Protein kinase domain-containing protein n=1 Tax=Collybiopsis confluens TaxID=2823264 RepID=A0A8H5HXB0_9AGAR|nr:hypothetical protein D9757_003090 [Collybiopsis confluens]